MPRPNSIPIRILRDRSLSVLETIVEFLKENKELSDKLDFITHHFPNELQDKLSALDFSEKFIK